MDQLLKVLPDLLESARNSPELREAAVLATWRHVAGEKLRDRAVGLSLEGQRLKVAVPDRLWQKQLRDISGEMLARLNAILGRNMVSFIEFVIDPALAAEPEPQVAAKPAETEGAIPVEVLSAAAAIRDTQLRRAFLGAVVSSERRRAGSVAESE